MKFENLFMTEHFDERGLKEGDFIEISPYTGKKKKMAIKRPLVCIYSLNSHFETLPMGSIGLSGPKNEEFLIELRREEVQTYSGSKTYRYFIIVIKGNPICLNGNYVYSGYIEHFDEIEFGFNKLKFIPQEEKGNQKKAEIPEYCLGDHLPILIEGETGTGKTRLAKSIHANSKRSGRFVHINIAAFNKNLLESELFGHIKGSFTGALNDKLGAIKESHKGTLFIDEIDSLPIEIQTKLLLFLDDLKVRSVGSIVESKVDVKLIFASGQKCQSLVAKNQMRKDFYYRLCSGHRFRLKPLRDDESKVRDICKEFEYVHSVFIAPELIEFYLTLPWPGNYRQIISHLKRKVSMSKGRTLSFDKCDEALIEESSELWIFDEKCERKTLKEIKENYVVKIFIEFKRDYKVAAEVLGISSRSLRNIIDTKNLQYKEY